MKTKRHRNRNVPNPVARTYPTAYEPAFKRSVILFAEQKGNQEARKRYGISEETIRRWRKLKKDIMEKAQQSIRRSQRHVTGQGSFSESGSPPTKSEKGIDKEKVVEEKIETKDPIKDLDSMPLKQRLSQNHNEPAPPSQPQETVLQSQPISPTKLKVTRQGKPQQPPPRVPTPPPPAPPQVCLKWNSHHVNMQTAFPNLLTKEQYVDATLVSEGKTLKCHRMILSSCSSYFEEVLNGIGPFQHPVLFMKDIPFWILKALCDFMYAGEVHILQDNLQELLNVATSLKIKGLVGSQDTNEDVKPIIPEIKQEIDSTPPPKTPDKPLKEEKEEEPPPPPPKPAKHEVAARPSKKKEDKKSKHASQAPKEKEKEKVVEEPPPPKVAPKAPPKVVAKAALPKLAPIPKTTVRNVMKNVIKPSIKPSIRSIAKPSTSKATHASRKSETSRKGEKHKAEVIVQKEKEKEKEKPILKKDNINDPLDLLQPVYEEIAKEEPPQPLKSISPAKLKERGNLQVKKGMNRRVKKRRYAEYTEEREESPPPLFSSRKGTRSRPNVKIPKFFHTHFDEATKETTNVTIVREPHTDQNDPLIGVEVEEIKAEPLDVEENTIEMEDNLVNYMAQDQEMLSQEDEEIIGNYDSPLVNIKREKQNTPIIFKKELDPEPAIMDIHTVEEPDARLLNIKEENLQIVDIARISTKHIEETIIGTSLYIAPPPPEKPSEIIISSVQSIAELSEDSCLRDRDKDHSDLNLIDPVAHSLPKYDARPVELHRREVIDPSDAIKGYVRVAVRPLAPATFTDEESCSQTDPILTEKVVDDHEADPLAPASVHVVDTHLADEVSPNVLHNSLEDSQEPETMETDESAALGFRIENVTTQNSQEDTVDMQMSQGSANADECSTIVGGSLGSLEARVGTLGLESQGSFLSQSQGSVLSQGQDYVLSQSQGEEAACSSDLGSLEDRIDTLEMGKDLTAKEDVDSQGNLPSIGPVHQEILLEDSACQSTSVGLDELQNIEPEHEKAPLEDDAACELITYSPEEIKNIVLGVEEVPSDNIERPELATEDTACDTEPMETDSQQETTEHTTTALDNTITASLSPPQLAIEDTVACLSKENTDIQTSAPENTETATVGAPSSPENVSVKNPDHIEANVPKSEQEMEQPVGILEAECRPEVEATESILDTIDGNHVSVAAKVEELPLVTSEVVASDKVENAETELMVVSQHSSEDIVADSKEIFEEHGDLIEEQLENAPPLEPQSTDLEVITTTDLVKSESTLNQKDIDESSEKAVFGNNEDKIESTDNIEAELEQCLASTSNLAPPNKTTEGIIRVSVKPLTFEEDEDFTKDVEFDTSVSRNRPANLLGDDFETDDFEMGELGDAKSIQKEAMDESSGALDDSERENVVVRGNQTVVRDLSGDIEMNEIRPESGETNNETGTGDLCNRDIESSTEVLSKEDTFTDEVNEEIPGASGVTQTECDHECIGEDIKVQGEKISEDIKVPEEEITNPEGLQKCPGDIEQNNIDERISSHFENKDGSAKLDTALTGDIEERLLAPIVTDNLEESHTSPEVLPGTSQSSEKQIVQTSPKNVLAEDDFSEELDQDNEMVSCAPEAQTSPKNLLAEDDFPEELDQDNEMVSCAPESQMSPKNLLAEDAVFPEELDQDNEMVSCAPESQMSPKNLLAEDAGFPEELDQDNEMVPPDTAAAVTDNLSEHHSEDLEEEKRMEEKLLADLDDDDVEMGDATTSQDSDDGSEKTLEMIVNDLNASLGVMKK